MPRRPSRKDLTRARDARRLVRVVRRKGWDQVEGYVVAVGREWLVMQSVTGVEDATYAGHVLLRRKDLRALKKPRSEPALSRQSLEQGGHWPPYAPGLLDLYDTRTVAFTAGSLSRLVTLARERRRPRDVVVADIARITQRHVDYRVVGRRREGRSRLTDLTRVVLWDPSVERPLTS